MCLIRGSNTLDQQRLMFFGRTSIVASFVVKSVSAWLIPLPLRLFFFFSLISFNPRAKTTTGGQLDLGAPDRRHWCKLQGRGTLRTRAYPSRLDLLEHASRAKAQVSDTGSRQAMRERLTWEYPEAHRSRDWNHRTSTSLAWPFASFLVLRLTF